MKNIKEAAETIIKWNKILENSTDTIQWQDTFIKKQIDRRKNIEGEPFESTNTSKWGNRFDEWFHGDLAR